LLILALAESGGTSQAQQLHCIVVLWIVDWKYKKQNRGTGFDSNKVIENADISITLHGL
jgi:hypothetical protein